MTPHDHPAVRDAALKLIDPTSDLYDKALLMHHDPGDWRLKRLIEAAAKVRARLDALDAAIAAAQAEAADAAAATAMYDDAIRLPTRAGDAA